MKMIASSVTVASTSTFIPSNNTSMLMLKPEVDWEGSGVDMVEYKVSCKTRAKEKRGDVGYSMKVALYQPSTSG